MARHVVSVLRGAVPALRGTDPGLEANAYAVAEDVDLTVVLRDAAVELALEGAEVATSQVAGVALPGAAAARDLRGLVESGVRVIADADSLSARGIGHAELIGGIAVAGRDELLALLDRSEGVLTW